MPSKFYLSLSEEERKEMEDEIREQLGMGKESKPDESKELKISDADIKSWASITKSKTETEKP